MTFGRVFACTAVKNAPKRIRVALGLAVLVGLGAVPAAAQEADACERFAAGEVLGQVGDPALVETSGVAASRAHDGVLWAHNDSGGQPALTALSETGEDLGTFTAPGATASDWEDMAAGPGPDPDTSYLYAGDIGDNGAARPSVQVHRVPEPAAVPTGADGQFAEDVLIELTYPDGPTDAEALLIDPGTGDLLIVAKRVEDAPVYLAEAAAIADGGPVTLRQVATLTEPSDEGPVGLVTGGDVSPDGSVVLLRTYGSVLAYERTDGAPLADALGTRPCVAPSVDEQQGEAVAFLTDGSAYVTISEGAAAPVHRFAVDPPLVTTTTTTDTTLPGDEAAAEDEDDDGGVPIWVWVALPSILIVAALAIAASRRARG
jgi:hypothetical protein